MIGLGRSVRVRSVNTNRKTIVQDSVGGVKVYEMDDTNAVIAITDPHGGRETYERCPNTAKVLKETNALGAVVEKAYDARGNLVRLTGPDGATTEIDYHDRMNLPTEARDALGRRWRWIYDGLGHLTARQNAAHETTMYEWSNAGLLTGVKTPGERVTGLSRNQPEQLRSRSFRMV